MKARQADKSDEDRRSSLREHVDVLVVRLGDLGSFG